MHHDDPKTRGKVDELKGKGKQAWGDVTDDESTEGKGKAEEMKGKGRQALGRARENFDKDDSDQSKRA